MVIPHHAPAPRPLTPPVVLLTGFEAFGGERINPSWLAVQALHGREVAAHRVVAAQLPTVFGASRGELDAQLRRHRPALVLCVGQAGGRHAISLERVAINVDDARIPDNARAQPVDTPIEPRGPAAYFSTLPIKAMRQALLADGVPAEVSQTAGTFVCNHVFYGLMHRLATERALAATRGGFIHVPWLPEQGTPALPLPDLVRGLHRAVQCALDTRTDIAVQAGAIA